MSNRFSTGIAEYAIDFGEAPNNPILFLEQLSRLRDSNSRKRSGHVKCRTFIERWHELAPEPERQWNGDREEKQIDSNSQPTVPQGKFENRQIDRLGNARERVL